MIITIDGLTATGKSSVARLLAQKLGYKHINSGLLYRALAYLLVEKYHYTKRMLETPAREGVDTCLDSSRCVYVYSTQAHTSSIVYDGKDITPYLMTKTVDLDASLVALDAYVHRVIAAYLRALGHNQNIVIDGRNAGSTVFPNAQVKFFLTASISIRADRWRKERGKEYTHQIACDAINERDLRDIHRPVAPLIIPDDAHVVDTSDMNQQEVCDYVYAYIQNIHLIK